jgi:O-antigen/teichoic acid export membrane protein
VLHSNVAGENAFSPGPAVAFLFQAMTETSSPGKGEGLDAAERLRLMRDGLVNNSSSVVSAVVGILLVPIMLRGLGTESYGLWIAMLVVLAVPGGFDFGLGAAVVREVAARRGEPAQEAATFVQSAGNAYLVYGALGGLAIATLGLPLSRGLHLSPAVESVAPAVFALGGVCFFVDQQLAFASATLRGLRRFDAVNSLAASAVLLRAAGIVVLLEAGQQIVALMTWYTLAGGAVAVLGLGLVARYDASLRFRLARMEWDSLRARMSFALASQVVRIVVKTIWEVGPLVVGLVLGSVWMVPFYVGEKFPRTVAGATWQAGEVLFPVASQDERAHNMARTRETLELGTRWVVFLALPACIIFWVLGPGLLRAWVGEVQPDAICVLRLMTGVILADALGLGALYILWGYGRTRTLVTVLGTAALSMVVLSVGMLRVTGIVGVSWAMLISIAMASWAFLFKATRMCGMEISELVRRSFRGLWLPGLVAAGVAVGLARGVDIAGWPRLVGASFVIGIAYLASFFFRGARAEEVELAWQIARLPQLAVRASLKIFRGFFQSSDSFRG